MFNRIKNKHYKNSKIITRVSGVKFNNEQNFVKFENFWKGIVDQVAFVDYNPWENSYNKEPNNIDKPCSDLWRRMFVWWNGLVNPCDVDYKSVLSVGKFEKSLSNLWLSKDYQNLRDSHNNNNRSSINPCKACNVI